jgi:hypothetical protein
MPNRIEKAASEVMGAVKSAKATAKGLTGVFRELMREHGEASALLSRIRKSSDPAVRGELFPILREKLLAHEKGEMTVVYPGFLANTQLESYAAIHDQDAGSIERSIGGLGVMAYDSAEWGQAFDALANAVELHVKEEENEYFPAAQRILGKQAAEEMRSRYETARDAAAKAARH